MSMTGFARESGALADGTAFAWGLRSVNGRGLDLRLRLPNGLDALEPALREATGRRLKRGNLSATLTLRREERGGPSRLAPDPAALDQALALALEVAGRIPGAPPPRAEALLALPGVMRPAEPAEPDEAAEEGRRAALAEAYLRALDGLVAARRAEGEKLAAFLGGLLDEIAALRGAWSASPPCSARAAPPPGCRRSGWRRRSRCSPAAPTCGRSWTGSRPTSTPPGRCWRRPRAARGGGWSS